MPGFKMESKDGSVTQYSVSIQPFLTHDESEQFYSDGVSFEITEITFQTSIGTYIDSPYHRYQGARDISTIELHEVILDGIAIKVDEVKKDQVVDLDVLENYNIKNKALLVNFGWDDYWGLPKYFTYPFISESTIDLIVEQKVKLVGVDTINVDHYSNLHRPAHSKFLANDIFVVENLTNLGQLIGKKFRFFAVPIKVKQAAAMPVRAFAEVNSP